MADPLRIRSADDPENPEAVVIERFERLKLKNDHQPKGWVIIAWHPSRAAAAETFEQVKASARERLGQAYALLAQLEPPSAAAVREAEASGALGAFEAGLRIMKAEMYQEIANATGVPVRGHMPHPLAAQRTGYSIAAALLGQWEAVMERFEKGVEP